MMLGIFLSLVIFLNITIAQDWFTNFEKGVKVAEQKSKLVLIYFYSNHCPYCHHVEEFVFGDKDVEEFLNKNFVVISIDYEEDEELSDKFKVFGTPYFVVFDPETGKVLKKIFGSIPKEQFLSLLTSVCNKSSLRRC